MKPIPFTGLIAAALTLLVAGQAGAESERFALSEPWKAECGSCHVAYPPQLLPADSWAAIFDGLDKHFGSDAALDPATTAALRDYAMAHAARAVSPAPLRITEMRWFRREHNEEISPLTWSLPAIGSPANCGACHSGAEQGDYSERGIRLPPNRP